MCVIVLDSLLNHALANNNTIVSQEISHGGVFSRLHYTYIW